MLIALLLVAAGIAILAVAAASLPPRVAGRAGIAFGLIGIGLAAAALFTAPDVLGPFRLDPLAGWTVTAVLVASSSALLSGARWAGLIPAAAILVVLASGPLLAVALVLLATVVAWQRRGTASIGAVAFHLVARIALAGIAPIGWGLAVLAVALLGAIGGGVSAATARRFEDALPGLAALATGLAVAGLGVSMAARGADLLPAATLGLEAALLFVLTGAVSLAALELAGAAIRATAGSGELAALGGLWPGMRATGLSAVIAAASLAVLPPSSGFAGFYLLLQSLFAANRIGGVFVQFGLACAGAACGLAAALGAMATLRLLGLALLGQARSDAAASARDPAGDPRLLMAALAAFGVLLGIAPGGALLLAAPALNDAGLPAAPPVLLPSIAAALLAVACAAVWAGMRQAPQARRVPAWEGGMPGAVQLTPYVPGLFASLRWRPHPRWPTLRECLAVAALALAAVLIVLAAR